MIAMTEQTAWVLDTVLRLGMAAILGGMVGIEREHRGQSAGLRTQLLVALGAALAMVVSVHFADVYGQAGATSTLRVDPARVAYGVMGGIGFLGAGAIIRYGRGVRGLTTAASLWCTAAVGLACGFGMFFAAIVTTVIVIAALLLLSRLERHIPSRWSSTVTVDLPGTDCRQAMRVRELIAGRGASIADMEYECDHKAGVQTVTVYVTMPSAAKLDDLAAIASEIPNILRIAVH